MSGRIRELNDAFRTKGEGNGRFMVTRSFTALGCIFQMLVLKAVRDYDDFTKESDFMDEHDFGSVEVMGQKVFWKIDYYDPTLQYESEDPADEKKTCRVLTIMLASDY
jgi:hypothetical protein